MDRTALIGAAFVLAAVEHTRTHEQHAARSGMILAAFHQIADRTVHHIKELIGGVTMQVIFAAFLGFIYAIMVEQLIGTDGGSLWHTKIPSSSKSLYLQCYWLKLQS